MEDSYVNPVHNGGPVKVKHCLCLAGYHLKTRLNQTLINCTIIFLFPRCFTQGSTHEGITSKRGMLTVIPCFKCLNKTKHKLKYNVQISTSNPYTNGSLSKLNHWSTLIDRQLQNLWRSLILHRMFLLWRMTLKVSFHLIGTFIKAFDVPHIVKLFLREYTIFRSTKNYLF